MLNYVCEYLESVGRDSKLCAFFSSFSLSFPHLPKKLSYYGSIWVNNCFVSWALGKNGCVGMGMDFGNGLGGWLEEGDK